MKEKKFDKLTVGDRVVIRSWDEMLRLKGDLVQDSILFNDGCAAFESEHTNEREVGIVIKIGAAFNYVIVKTKNGEVMCIRQQLVDDPNSTVSF